MICYLHRCWKVLYCLISPLPSDEYKVIFIFLNIFHKTLKYFSKHFIPTSHVNLQRVTPRIAEVPLCSSELFDVKKWNFRLSISGSRGTQCKPYKVSANFAHKSNCDLRYAFLLLSSHFCEMTPLLWTGAWNHGMIQIRRNNSVGHEIFKRVESFCRNFVD